MQRCAALPFLPLLPQQVFGGPPSTKQHLHQAPIKVFLDTDIGSDIDDAVALAYLLRQSRCELLGITTVTGQATERARLASTLCHAAGVNIPIVAGHETPLRIKQRQVTAPQAEKLAATDGSEFKQPSAQRDAIEFMRDTIRQNPGEVVLLAVGPLTNLAHLFQLDPELPGLLKRLVIMAGKYSDYPTPWGPTEWNAIVDPHATDIVFRAAAEKITAFGLDITWQVSMTPQEVQTRFATDPLLKIVRTWSDVWFRERELLHFHDPLAAAAIFAPGICEYHRGDVNIELGTVETAGITHFKPRNNGPLTIANAVAPDLFFREYFDQFQTHTDIELTHVNNAVMRPET